MVEVSRRCRAMASWRVECFVSRAVGTLGMCPLHLPTFIMSVFQLPLTLCDELTSMIREFWWGGNKGMKKMVWLAWDKMILKKSWDGLGFKDL